MFKYIWIDNIFILFIFYAKILAYNMMKQLKIDEIYFFYDEQKK